MSFTCDLNSNRTRLSINHMVTGTSPQEPAQCQAPARMLRLVPTSSGISSLQIQILLPPFTLPKSSLPQPLHSLPTLRNTSPSSPPSHHHEHHFHFSLDPTPPLPTSTKPQHLLCTPSFSASQSSPQTLPWMQVGWSLTMKMWITEGKSNQWRREKNQRRRASQEMHKLQGLVILIWV